MLIESVTAHGFGALRNQTLTFDPGLTVVCGLNESAKSTWHAAVYAAICGRARKRGAAGRSQQEFAARYRPWDGTTWEVEATLRLDDARQIQMHHDLDGQVNCAATDLTTGRDLSAGVMYEGSPDASVWLGMNRDIFSAIACVRQADILSVLGSAGSLQEQLESAATHAGTSDPTAAQAIGIIGAFLKENVGKDRSNSTKPLRRAGDDVLRCREALDEARSQHEQYMGLVREAARLRSEVAAREAAVEQAQADLCVLTDRRDRAAALASLTADVQAAQRHGASLAQRLARADLLRAQGADVKPEPANDARILTEVTRALTRWRNLPAPPTLTGPDSATLQAQLDAVPALPVGDQRPDPALTQACRRLQIAKELASQKQREQPPVPELSAQGRAAAVVGAVTLRTWAAELDRIRDVPAEEIAQAGAASGGQSSTTTSMGLVAGVVAALAGIALVLTGNTAIGVGLIAVGFIVAILGRPRADALSAEADQSLRSLRLAQEAATAQRQAVQASASAAGLPADAEVLRTLAAEVERWAQQGLRHATWEGQSQAAGRAANAAGAELAGALALRGISGPDPEAAYAEYETACHLRAEQAVLAARRDSIATQLTARTAAERASARAEADAASVRDALRAAAEAAGLDSDDPDTLEQWAAAQQISAAQLSARQDSWTQYQRILGDLTYAQLREQAEQATATASRMRERRDADAARLGPISADLPTTVDAAKGRLSGLEAELLEFRQEAATAEGRQQDRATTLPSVAESEERLELAEQDLARVRDLESTLQRTCAYLQDAQEKVHHSIAPTLQATLVRWLPQVTGGRYTQAAVDPQTLRVRVQTGSGKWVEASQLSVGTAEQIYLLLRVALVIHLSDPAASCPLLLDDVTVQADHARTRALLDTLAQLATQRQVILFAQEPAVEQWAREHADTRLVILEPVPA